MSPFHFLLLDGFTMQAYSSAVEVLRLANQLSGNMLFPYKSYSVSGESVAASNAIRVMPDASLDDLMDIQEEDAKLVLLAGAGAIDRPKDRVSSDIRTWYRRGQAIWALSSGIVILAKTGLLDGEIVSAHWEDKPWLQAHYPDIAFSDHLFEMNQRFPTCCGGQAAADMMLRHVADHIGPNFVADISSRLIIEQVRDGKIRQMLPIDQRFQPSNPIVYKALSLMQDHLYQRLKISKIADQIGVSQRQLERLFRQEMGRTPLKMYEAIRMESARNEVLLSRRALLEIALDYEQTQSEFAQSYKKIFALTPSEDRKRARSLLRN